MNSLLILNIVLLAICAILLKQLIEENEFDLNWIYPYALMWTPFREELYNAWQTHFKLNTAIRRPSLPIAEIEYKDYSFESVRQASNNFRKPVVVRGMFKDTKAVREWGTPDYLPSKFKEYVIPIVRNAVVGTLQDDRVLVNFADAFKDMYDSEYAKEYLFFPVKSRFTFNGSEAGSAVDLQTACDNICKEDLELDRIWPGFASSRHTTFNGAQFVIGKSTPEFTNKSTGSDWHCAAGNNWFVQVAGRKKWEFVEPRFSPYLTPLKGGFFNMWTGNKEMAKVQQHVPTNYVILEEGDMVYNPDWMWHKITNFGGLSIGIPVRERNMTLMFQNNFYFSSIVVTNKILTEAFGLSLGGFPPASRATEADN